MSKLIVLFVFLVIIFCLGSGLYYLVRRGSQPANMAKSLTWRIALSLALFGFLFFAFYMGWIVPHGISG